MKNIHYVGKEFQVNTILWCRIQFYFVNKIVSSLTWTSLKLNFVNNYKLLIILTEYSFAKYCICYLSKRSLTTCSYYISYFFLWIFFIKYNKPVLRLVDTAVIYLITVLKKLKQTVAVQSVWYYAAESILYKKQSNILIMSNLLKLINLLHYFLVQTSFISK